MKILVDTNILFSAMLFRGSKPAKALLHVSDFHEMVLCDRSLYELYDVLKRKTPEALPDAEVFLTGDKDFLSLDLEHPRCLTVAQFLEEEGVEL